MKDQVLHWYKTNGKTRVRTWPEYFNVLIYARCCNKFLNKANAQLEHSFRLSFCPYASSPKLLNYFRRNLLLGIYTNNCRLSTTAVCYIGLTLSLINVLFI
jgi:hypothetical protein